MSFNVIHLSRLMYRLSVGRLKRLNNALVWMVRSMTRLLLSTTGSQSQTDSRCVRFARVALCQPANNNQPPECRSAWATITLALRRTSEESQDTDPRMVLVHVGFLVLPVFGSVRNRGTILWLTFTPMPKTCALFILIFTAAVDQLVRV